ncbi:right-handed parallel beta-helix repeat-containing protein [Streptomyces sp. DW26H14]|uniref:right-handed parallel beta-helix repeat-containing protein n=1 Tax=Streptomyces sp. DW26H14 TaxID=3435395 RepID=UPI00403DE3E9
MTLYTFGGTPADVLTDAAGNVIPDYPLTVRVAGTGATVTALFEDDGTTPIGQLQSNPATSSMPGAIRTFKAQDVAEIEFEYLDKDSNPVRWYEAARELASNAAQAAADAEAGLADKLDRTGGTISGDLTVQGALTVDGQPITPSGSLTAAGIFTVSGAAGDGATDDHDPIQAALDAAHAAGGGTVVIPAGKTYAVGTFLVVYDHTTIWAYGATLRSSGNTGLLRNFLGTETFTGYAGHSHIQVLGGTWDGNASDGTTGTVTAETDVINFVHCTDVTVRDATIMNVSSAHALEFNSTDGGRAIDCRFLGFRDNSEAQNRGPSEAIQIDIAVSGSSSIGAYDKTASRNIRVEGCYFGPSDRLGVFGKALGSHTLAAGVTYDDIAVLDNRIDGTLHEGMQAYGWRRARIAGNLITGTGASGILATIPDPATTSVPAHTLTIDGNTVEGSAADSGIRVIGFAAYRYPGVAVTGNTVKGATGNAVQVENCTGPIVADNTVDTTSSTGLYANYSPDAVFTGNVVRNAASNGINATGSPGALISGNLVDTTGSNFGIFTGQAADAATNTTDALITSNTVTAAASAGIRCSTGSARCTITGNKIRKGSGATVNGIMLAANSTGCVIAGNDLSGNSWTAAVALFLSTAAPVLDYAGGKTAPGHNLI